MLEISIAEYKNLSPNEQAEIANGDDDLYLRVRHNHVTILLESDYFEPEDVSFSRDLSWVPKIIRKVYNLGRLDEKLRIILSDYKEGDENAS